MFSMTNKNTKKIIFLSMSMIMLYFNIFFIFVYNNKTRTFIFIVVTALPILNVAPFAVPEELDSVYNEQVFGVSLR